MMHSREGSRAAWVCTLPKGKDKRHRVLGKPLRGRGGTRRAPAETPFGWRHELSLCLASCNSTAQILFDSSQWPRFKGKLPRLASWSLINKAPAFLWRLVSIAHTLCFCQAKLFIVPPAYAALFTFHRQSGATAEGVIQTLGGYASCLHCHCQTLGSKAPCTSCPAQQG